MHVGRDVRSHIKTADRMVWQQSVWVEGSLLCSVLLSAGRKVLLLVHSEWSSQTVTNLLCITTSLHLGVYVCVVSSTRLKVPAEKKSLITL